MRRTLGLALAAVVLAALLLDVPATADRPSGGGEPATVTLEAAAKRCKQARVNGRRTCLRVRKRCRARHQQDCFYAGFECHRSRLRRASQRALRRGRSLALGRSGLPTFAQARAAFDRLVANLPGVSPVPWVVGPAPSGTPAIDWLARNKGRLTPAQRAVLIRVLSPHDDAARVAQAVRGEFEAIVREAVPRILAKGLTFRHPIAVRVDTADRETAHAYTVAQWLHGTGNDCEITIMRSGVAADLAFRRQIVLHELLHCAMDELAGANHASLPAWIKEGLTQWAEFRLAVEWNGTVRDDGWWGVWLRSASTLDLYVRTYDAVGFWALMERAGVNLWAMFPTIVQAGGADQAYRAVSGAARGDWSTDWGTTMATSPGLAARWDLGGPGMPRPGLRAVGLANRTVAGRVLYPRGGFASKLALSADVLHVASAPGLLGVLRDAAGAERSLPSDARFCAKPGGCVCEDGRRLEFPPIAAGTGYLGVSAQAAGGFVVLTGEPLEQHCDEPEKEPGRPPKGGPGIVVTDRNQAPLVRFTSMRCRVDGAGFHADGSAGGWRLRVRIQPFGGFHRYEIRYGVGSSAYFTLDPPGRGRTFSNVHKPDLPTPGPDLTLGGAVGFRKGRSIVGVGFAIAYDGRFPRPDWVTLGGNGARCNYPPR